MHLDSHAVLEMWDVADGETECRTYCGEQVPLSGRTLDYTDLLAHMEATAWGDDRGPLDICEGCVSTLRDKGLIGFACF